MDYNKPIPDFISELMEKYGSNEWEYVIFRIANLEIMGVPKGQICLFLFDTHTHCNFEHEDGTDLI